MAAYATGIHSEAICDRCGQRFKYLDLKKEWTGFKVCPECYEPKAPQLYPLPAITEPQALYEPRPDVRATMTVLVGQSIFPEPKNISLQAMTFVGTVTVNTDVSGVTVSLTGVTSSSSVGSVSVTPTTVFAVTVANPGSGNKFYIDGVQQATLTLNEGSTYRFDQSDSSNGSPTHPLRCSTISDGTWGGGSDYTTAVTTNGTPGTSGAYTEIEVATGAPTLYYYCSNHSGMGGQANTP